MLLHVALLTLSSTLFWFFTSTFVLLHCLVHPSHKRTKTYGKPRKPHTSHVLRIFPHPPITCVLLVSAPFLPPQPTSCTCIYRIHARCSSPVHPTHDEATLLPFLAHASPLYSLLACFVLVGSLCDIDSLVSPTFAGVPACLYMSSIGAPLCCESKSRVRVECDALRRQFQ